jgi:enamine deaminase RidA (YjgF/YER057c/UK114 family)
MTDSIQDRIAALGITLPEPAAPVAAYVPAVEAAGLLHVSGQLPFEDGELMMGRMGEDRDLEYGQRAARACGIMLLAQINKALGGLDRVERVVKLGVFISSAPASPTSPRSPTAPPS